MASKKSIIDDAMLVTINLRWLIQLVVVVAMAVYGFWKFHDRITELERTLTESVDKIESIESARREEEEKFKKELTLQRDRLEEQMKDLWYEKDLNLNPLSWGKKKSK